MRIISENIEAKWYPEIQDNAKDTPFVLVGTKSDLRHDEAVLEKLKERRMHMQLNCGLLSLDGQNNSTFIGFSGCSTAMLNTVHMKNNGQTAVTNELASATAKKLGATAYIECSAMTQQGVREVFEEATRKEYSSQNIIFVFVL